MRIAMFTNTFAPHVGGVARSVQAFAGEYRRRGHQVLVVAPEFAGRPADEPGVVRIPAIQNFNGSDFSFPVPVPAGLRTQLDAFAPEILHSHHPFLLGDTALRVAAERGLPVVFTHHTLYERYTHYVPGSAPAMQRAASELAVGYANLCAAVLAPSASIAALLGERGVTVPVAVVPTGVDLARFAAGNREAGRRLAGVAAEAKVLGHVGRLAVEKNLGALAASLVRACGEHPEAVALVVGDGPDRQAIADAFAGARLADRLRLPGVLEQQALVDAYAAMDVFVFTSRSETQGMVLTEALAAGVPLVAVDAPGARDVVVDGLNGRLLPSDDPASLAAAISVILDADVAAARRLAAGVRQTASLWSLERTAACALTLYRTLIGLAAALPPLEETEWELARRRLAEEWKIVRNIARAIGALQEEPE